ncbi:SDR family oxidoreductase [Corynebacterium sp. 320]|uniref:SDR family oxidoreductase n=1 Tax=Corynebacterium TaxID=1716 RepID=UPI00125CCC1B|nr:MULTISPECIES: SDR family oxidoreductase [Corynebacterium]KAB1503800.1 SDR family oxidoreductase [Corynebacterium sp. 320]KAB1553100.1 SDR family oxidoreductase [Corynebacterium sp. 321]KAB1553682.1 SDR family oxidoreductase [Corynebacterium sp. 319]KAB3527936.1 SDR family oxidoreductase [Corynebacterium sp. 250]KAB3540575.1 SDR family oxidoreductase [Corynebacterium sp. 366]
MKYREPNIVVITGAASGIGRALALSFTDATLLLADRDEAGLADTARQCTGCHVDTEVLDIADVEAVTGWADRVVAEFGVPDEVHHVAGISLWGDARSLPHDKWQKVIDINLMGSIHMVEAFAHYLGDGHKPRRKLVFVSSAAGILGLPWHAAYSASKAGVMGMAEVLRFDMKPLGVDVHVVAPGAVDTPLVHSIDIHGVDRSNKRVQKATALFQGHAISPEDAAQAIRAGVRKNKYLITTSRDIAVARWAQVNCPWAYKAAMTLLNRGFAWARR